VPLLAEFHPRDFTIRPLPGFTNHNFHLQNNEHDWILRLPKPETNQTINRQHEAHNASVAYSLGITPDCIWRDQSGISLSVCLPDSRPLNTDDIACQTTLGKLLSTIVRLHKSKKNFLGSVDLADLLSHFFEQVPGHLQGQIETSYRTAMAKLERLPDTENILVPSHNDLVLENILIDAAGKIWLIDWEYASMASPYWDLATLCNAAKLDQTKCTELITAYNNDQVDLVPEILVDYRYILGVLSTCWMAVFTGLAIETEMEY